MAGTPPPPPYTPPTRTATSFGMSLVGTCLPRVPVPTVALPEAQSCPSANRWWQGRQVRVPGHPKIAVKNTALTWSLARFGLSSSCYTFFFFGCNPSNCTSKMTQDILPLLPDASSQHLTNSAVKTTQKVGTWMKPYVTLFGYKLYYTTRGEAEVQLHASVLRLLPSGTWIYAGASKKNPTWA